MKIWQIIIVFIVLSSFVYGEPITVYGQVLLDSKPAEHIEITASWVGSDGKEHHLKALTLTEEEAIKKGFPYLYGCYSFNIDGATYVEISVEGVVQSIRLGPVLGNEILMSPIVINTQGLISQILSSFKGSGGIQNPSDAHYLMNNRIKEPLDSLSGDFSTQGNTAVNDVREEQFLDSKESASEIPNKVDEAIDAKKTLVAKEPTEPVISKAEIIQSVSQEEKKVDLKLLLKIFGAIVFAAVVFMFLLFLRKNFLAKIVKGLTNISFSPVINQSRKIMRMGVRRLMRPLDPHSKSIEYGELMAIIMEQGKTYIPVFEHGICLSVVSPRILLSVEGDSKKAYEFMKEQVFSVTSGASLETAYELMDVNNYPYLIVMEDEKPVGELSLVQIQKELSGFSRFYRAGSNSGLDTVRKIMSPKFLRVEKDQSLDKMKQLFLQAEIPFAVVFNDDHPVGVFTIKDYLKCLYKHGHDISNHYVSSFMTPSIVRMDPEKNIFEASEFMTENQYSVYPVISDDEVIGILTRRMLCRSIFDYFRRID